MKQCETIGRKYERDIDLLLAEEFMVSQNFAAWFLGKTRFAGVQAEPVDVFVSKADSTGESDLVVIYEEVATSQRFAIHIEDKIDAPLQPDQVDRYRQRANGEIDQGHYGEFEIVLCAPQFYKDSQPGARAFDRYVSYGDIADFIAANDSSPRGQYRSRFLASATSRRTNSWKKVDDEKTNLFWAEIYRIASREFPILEMKEPNFTKDSTWINFRPADMPTMPRRIYISFKGSLGYMDLTFTRCVSYQFEKRIRSLLDCDGLMTVHQTGQSSAIRLKVDSISILEPLGESMVKIRAAFSACEKLITFYRNHRDELMQGAALCVLA